MQLYPDGHCVELVQSLPHAGSVMQINIPSVVRSQIQFPLFPPPHGTPSEQPKSEGLVQVGALSAGAGVAVAVNVEVLVVVVVLVIGSVMVVVDAEVLVVVVVNDEVLIAVVVLMTTLIMVVVVVA